MTRERASGTTRIAIAGGGVAAVEAMLALSDLGGPNAEIDVFSPRAEFLYRPLAVTEPFGLGEILRFDLDELARECGASFHRESVRSVESDRREIGLHDGSEVGYDHLLVATGTKQRWVVPGASTFWAAGDEDGVTDVIERLRGGEIRSAIFTMPSGSGWPLPVYELALLTAAELARANLSARLVVVTPEEAPLQLFGVRAAEEVADYLTDHGVEVITGAHPVSFDGRELAIAPGDPIPAEAVVSMPRLEGRCLEGLPHDSDGFIPIDDHCRVNGCERVFAAGDVTTFPVKQGASPPSRPTQQRRPSQPSPGRGRSQHPSIRFCGESS
jgi:sulfide:quinone oxidoreductase